MTVADAQTNDAMTLDAFPQEEDVSTSDAELPADLGIDAEPITQDMTVQDAATILVHIQTRLKKRVRRYAPNS